MPTTGSMSVQDLNLDLSNYRTVPQPDETTAVQALVSISPDMFWGLMRSIIEDGYLPTENIIVFDDGSNPRSLRVKEGNRRIAILKLLLGLLPFGDLSVPADILAAVAALDIEWRSQNQQVPCTIFTTAETDIVKKIVARTHGLGAKAGRDKWNAVARARHQRDDIGGSDPALDLLEKYLVQEQNLTPQQRARWAGEYPLTVLDEAIKGTSKRFGVKNAPELAKQYPAIAYRAALDGILLAIGNQVLGFPQIRDRQNDFAASYGLPPVKISSSPPSGTPGGAGATSTGAPGASSGGAGGETGQSTPGAGTPPAPGPNGPGGAPGLAPNGKEPKSVPVNDPRAVKRLLRQFQPSGTKRAKLATLREEARQLNLEHNPIAFCFLLRSMFELSAKAYFDDHGLPLSKSKGQGKPQDKFLSELLHEATDHLTNNMQDQTMKKALHGALTELAKPNGILSVTSMNQLVHNPAFVITTGDICVLFGNIFPLLSALNN